MIRDTRTERYLKVGDRLVERGKFRTAARVYSRYADACRAESLMSHARALVTEDPVAALGKLAQVEKIMGASGEGRRLIAEAYTRLGRAEIAERYFKSCG